MAAAALEGILVADFSRVLAGPLAAMTLGDLGADVVKVERPGTGDDTRSWGPPWTERGPSYHLGLNRNKRSIALDLRDPADRELAFRLATRADVVLSSFRPGTMERLGLGREAIAAVNPGVITCEVTAFGAAELPGYDLLLQAVGGLMSVTGEPDGPPLKVGAAVIDLVCGLYATVGILAALQARARDPEGRGQHVESVLMDAALAALLNQGSAHLLAGVVPGRLGNRHPSIAPYATYEASDGPFALAVGSDGLWERLRALLDLPDDPRFVTNAGRREHVDELDALLAPAFARAPAAEWVRRLGEAGIPAGPINDVAGAFALAREVGLEPTVEIDGLQLLRTPVRLSRTPPGVRLPPPALDGDGAELRAWLASSEPAPPPATAG